MSRSHQLYVMNSTLFKGSYPTSYTFFVTTFWCTPPCRFTSPTRMIGIYKISTQIVNEILWLIGSDDDAIESPSTISTRWKLLSTKYSAHWAGLCPPYHQPQQHRILHNEFYNHKIYIAESTYQYHRKQNKTNNYRPSFTELQRFKQSTKTLNMLHSLNQHHNGVSYHLKLFHILKHLLIPKHFKSKLSINNVWISRAQ